MVRPSRVCFLATKCRTKSGISSRRWRSGGTSMGKTARRKYKSGRKRCSCMACRRSRFVAAITRTSTFVSVWEPSRQNTPSWSTRSSFDCSSRGSSPISSRKIVPPSATSKRPNFRLSAPVKAPFSYPNSSLSIEAGRQGRTVHLDQRAIPAGTVLVNRPGHQFLAGARLAQDQDVGVGVGHLLDLLQGEPQRRTLANQLLEADGALDFLAEIDVFRGEPLAEPLHFRQRRANPTRPACGGKHRGGWPPPAGRRGFPRGLG